MESRFILDDQIDSICDRFETAWKSTSEPEILDFWEALPGDSTNRLLADLVRLDVDYRSKGGKDFSLDFYLQRFPGTEGTIDEILSAGGDSKCSTKVVVDLREADTVTRGATMAPLEQIGPYRMLKQIGSGGMGVVYLAEQLEPVRRRVAVKLMRAEMDTPELLARFEIESQALSMMNHPNIARVLDFGKTEKGCPFMAMEYVEGLTLTKYCDYRQLSINDRLGLFGQLCAAIEHAHRKGVLHRDLKPSNILVCEEGANVVVKVIDFGLARAVDPQRRLAENTLVTLPGNALGTIEYMSPEQAEMNELGLDTRTDVYSLGVILYELLTGTTPLTRERVINEGLVPLIMEVVEGQFQRPSVRLIEQGEKATQVAVNRQSTPQRLSGMLRQELDWICGKSLRKNRSQRYDGVGPLLTDIRNYLSGDVVTARPPTLGYQLGKTFWKHRAVFAVCGLLLIILCGGWWTTTNSLVKTRQQQKKAKEAQQYSERMESLAQEEARDARDAEKEARDAEKVARDAEKGARDHEATAKKNLLIAEKGNYLADMLVIQNDWENGKGLKRIFSLLEKYRQRPDLTGFEYAYWNHQTSRLTQQLMKHDLQQKPSRIFVRLDEARAALQVKFSPSGQQAASLVGDDSIRVWDLASETEVQRVNTPTRVGWGDTVQFSPDGRKLLLTQGARAFTLDAVSGQTLTEMEAGHKLYAAAYSADQKEIVTASTNFTLIFWDSLTGEKLRSSEGILPADWTGIAMRNSIAAVKKDDRAENLNLKVWDVQAESWCPIQYPTASLRYLQSNAGFLARVAPSARYILQLNTMGKEIEQINRNGVRSDFTWPPEFYARISASNIDSTGKYIAVGNPAGQICWWHVDRPTEPHLIQEGVEEISCLDFSPDGKRLISVENSGDMRVFDLLVKSFPSVNRFPFSGRRAALSINRKHLILQWQGRINVVDVETEQQVDGFRDLVTPGQISSLAVANSGRFAVVSQRDGTLKRFETNSGKEAWTWKGVKRNPFAATVSIGADDQNVLVDNGKQIVILDAGDGSVVRSWDADQNSVRRLAFQVDANHVASTSSSGKFRFWDASNGRQIWQSPGSRGDLINFAFSGDGKVLVRCHNTNTNVLEAETGKQIGKINAFSSQVAVNQDGRRVALLEENKNVIKIRDVESGREVLSFQSSSQFVWFAFGWDDQSFLAQTGAGELLFWNLGTGDKG